MFQVLLRAEDISTSIRTEAPTNKNQQGERSRSSKEIN